MYHDLSQSAEVHGLSRYSLIGRVASANQGWPRVGIKFPHWEDSYIDRGSF
jgi:hypothetical protein